MKPETAKRLTRDCLSMAGLACIIASIWLCPPIALLVAGVAMVGSAVAWQRSEWHKTQGAQTVARPASMKRTRRATSARHNRGRCPHNLKGVAPMATAVTKKPTTTGPRTLADCPQWQEALAVRKRLEEQLHRYAVVADAPAGDAGIVRQLVGKLLDWARGTSKDAPAIEQLASPAVGNLAEQREAARLALEEHNGAMERLRLQLAGELYPAWSDEHREARQRIAKAVVELKEAIIVEQLLAEQMAAAGA